MLHPGDLKAGEPAPQGSFIACMDCHTRLYEFTSMVLWGEVVGAHNLRPCHKEAPPLIPGSVLVCPECGRATPMEVKLDDAKRLIDPTAIERPWSRDRT